VKTPNVFRAVEAKTGQTVYFVGNYDDGRYVRRLSDTERQLTGCSTEIGSLSYVGCQYNNEASARSAALRWYGYSKIADAYGNIGDRYERL
jgi:hypothetical protein